MPKGHTLAQVWQPMQASWSTTTRPSSSRFVMAPTGQFSTHAGLSQWLQA